MRSLVRSAVAVGLIVGCFFIALAARPRPVATTLATADAPTGSARSASTQALAAQTGAAAAAKGRAASTVVGPVVSTAVRFDVSPPLRTITPIVTVAPKVEDEREVVPTGGSSEPDPVVQGSVGRGPEVPAPATSFPGISNMCNCSPPDPDGAVGPNHYVEMINLHYQIFNKAGVSLLGPFANNTIWAGFGGPCQIENAGDPVVIHDQLADRWLLTQFTGQGPLFYNCVALSQTSNPTGSYYRWAFPTFNNSANFPDYPKYGLWPEAYYLSTREFVGTAGPFSGVGAYALNRAQMLAGNPTPTVISFLLQPGGTPYYPGDGLLPSDLDGATLPPAGSPNYFVGSMDNGGPYGAPSDALNLWKFKPNFVTPASSTFTGPTTIPTAPFDSVLSLCGGTRNCIPQPGTANRLDHLGYRQRPEFRLAYRNFGTHESLVTNQSVEAPAGMSGMRWWEIRSPNSSPFLFQDATYSPGATDGIHRWMGSIAADKKGNMALGYSVSSGTVFPGVRYTGRLVGDAINSLPQGEGAFVNGTGSQTGSQRWGDYTAMTVDPVDDCTFWFVNEYIPTTSAVGWRTWIGSFKFPSCDQPTAVRVLALTARWDGSAVAVSWRTASEAEALGYNLYRSVGSGAFRKVNAKLIVAKQHARGAYRFVDRNVRRGVAYTYRLQIVDRAGKRSWHSVGSAAS